VRLLYMTRKIEFDEKARVREKFRAMRLACASLQHFSVFFIGSRYSVCVCMYAFVCVCEREIKRVREHARVQERESV